MADKEGGYPRSPGRIQICGGGAERPPVLFPVHPHGRHQPPQVPVHHLPPLPATQTQGSFGHQLVIPLPFKKNLKEKKKKLIIMKEKEILSFILCRELQGI